MRNYKMFWDDIWMRLAQDIATRSNDPRLQVGAVIVTNDNESVLAVGYNGDEKGGDNQPDCLEPGKSGFIHAEANALIKMNYGDHRNKKMYLTHSPCPVCARMIVNAGIKTVYYCESYRDTKGLQILIDAGVNVQKFDGCTAD